jgi:L-alanine-DL-glutamate epimerase-like enolase superfamily enzyme
MSATSRSLEVEVERWPLREPFAISRRTFHDSLVLSVCVHEGGLRGWGEAEPHEHEQIVGLEAQAELLRRVREPGWLQTLTRHNIGQRLASSPMRNALDCALWDLEAKRRGVRAWALDPAVAKRVGGAVPVPLTPTVALDGPATMAKAAARHRGAPMLKIKLGDTDGRDAERMEAVADACPGMPLLVDVNGGWTPATLRDLMPVAQRHGVVVIEQPLPPGADAELPRAPDGLRFCADESCTDRSSLSAVARHYQMINVKLDKTGGLGEALALVDAAAALGLPWMVGSNGGTSLAMAPLYLLAHGAVCVDAGVGLLVRDREPPLEVRGGNMHPPPPALWG